MFLPLFSAYHNPPKVGLYFHRMQPRSQGPQSQHSDEEQNELLMDSVNAVDLFGHTKRLFGEADSMFQHRLRMYTPRLWSELVSEERIAFDYWD